MIAIPAIDLREGACVQLVGGSYANERVREPDPVAVARRWAECGFTRLHVVDLDAATGRGSNDAAINDILRESSLLVSVGGGVRTTERVAELLMAGAHRVVIGTRALEDAAWLADVSNQFPEQLIVAADARRRGVVTRGWTRAAERDVVAAVRDITEHAIDAILVTAVHREGLLEGPDLALMDDVVAAARVPVIAAGGVGSRRDLENLADRGVSAAVVGMALYTGALGGALLAEEFGE